VKQLLHLSSFCRTFAPMKKIGFLIALLFLAGSEIWAQGCVTCTNTAAGLGEASAKGLNSGILYLAAVPLILIFTVGIIWYRRSKSIVD
jgi:hypothetical protein